MIRAVGATIVGCVISGVGFKICEYGYASRVASSAVSSSKPTGDDKGKVTIEGAISFDTFKKFKTDFKKAVDSQEDKIYITLETFGGCASSTQLIAHIISNCPKKIICEIDSYALSAGTLIALSCDEIHMKPDSVISPIDPIIVEDDKKYLMRDYPEVIRKAIRDTQNSGLRVTVKDHYEAESQELYFGIYKDRVRKILCKKHSSEVTDNIVKHMIDTYQPHNRIYTVDEAMEVVPYIKVVTE